MKTNLLKKIFTLSLAAGVVLVGANSTILAESRFNEIPGKMQPNTIICYDEIDGYSIIQGGELNMLYNSNENGLTEVQQFYANENKRFALGQVEYPEAIIEVNTPDPTEGLVVVYDNDGFIKEYQGMNLRAYTALKPGTTSPVGTYTWGKNNNTLTVTSNTVTGKGRFTTFSDKIGDNDNTLKKGDVATRGDMDNPKSGTEISVTAKKNGTNTSHKQTMTKNDNGSMPDGILDIWKTGVEYWGYTWSSTLSIYDGSYTYTK